MCAREAAGVGQTHQGAPPGRELAEELEEVLGTITWLSPPTVPFSHPAGCVDGAEKTCTTLTGRYTGPGDRQGRGSRCQVFARFPGMGRGGPAASRALGLGPGTQNELGWE